MNCSPSPVVMFLKGLSAPKNSTRFRQGCCLLVTAPSGVTFTGPEGQVRTFRVSRSHETYWVPTVVAEAVSFEPLLERDTTLTSKKPRKRYHPNGRSRLQAKPRPRRLASQCRTAAQALDSQVLELRDELQRTKRERDILKKALAIFSQQE